ncbi:hypothetical protein QE400_000112 [Xanthomonas sacchari]|uniref:hypothetical protein n=1 Tax=Xanthomonas sacchari TaxID=56458 RepID=UPI00278A18A4|nr:hypothetical protein [Xanthomonas sacchari]MDQ1090699.1 hypothetical protein [Xanthomonas sacchari]
MTTKVANDEAEIAVRRRMAAALGFVVATQRWQGITLQKVAVEAETHRSNLSSFIRSYGSRRNISDVKLRAVLFALGLHWDLTLTRSLHRWDLGTDQRLIDGLRVLLDVMAHFSVRVITTAGCRESFFLVIADGGAVAILRAEGAVATEVAELLGAEEGVDESERTDSEVVQRIWLTQEVSVAEGMVRGLMACSGGTKKVERRPEGVVRSLDVRQSSATA